MTFSSSVCTTSPENLRNLQRFSAKHSARVVSQALPPALARSSSVVLGQGFRPAWDTTNLWGRGFCRAAGPPPGVPGLYGASWLTGAAGFQWCRRASDTCSIRRHHALSCNRGRRAEARRQGGSPAPQGRHQNVPGVARFLPFFLLTAFSLSAAVDGIVTNATTGKPQPGSTVTLFQPTQQGPQFIDSVKTDAQGKFQITKEVPAGGAGPLLLQAVYGGVQYNKMLPPGTPTTGVEIPVFETSKKQGEAQVDQHMILLEPAPGGTLQVSESYVFQNNGKTTWSDPDNGTLRFALPAAAQGKVEVNAVAPGGLPVRKAPDPGVQPNTYKLDFPIKPGESRVDLTWSMPFNTPGVYEEKILTPGGLTRLVAPVGVTFKGGDLQDLGQEPRTKANIYGVKGSQIKIDVQGTGTLNQGADTSSAGGDSAGGGEGGNGGGQPALTMNLPKLYGLALGSADLPTSVMAVKWILLTVIGMLAAGFVILYRKGNPIQTATLPNEPLSKAKNARGRG